MSYHAAFVKKDGFEILERVGEFSPYIIAFSSVLGSHLVLVSQGEKHILMIVPDTWAHGENLSMISFVLFQQCLHRGGDGVVKLVFIIGYLGVEVTIQTNA